MSSRYRHECPEGCKVFVGNLNRNTSREQLETIFGRFGELINVWLATHPPGYAFIMFGHRSDARKAVDELNDTRIDGRYVTVELATGRQRTHGHNNHNYNNKYRSSRRNRSRSEDRSDRTDGNHRNRAAYRNSDDRRHSDRSVDRRNSGRTVDRSPPHSTTTSGHYSRYSREKRSPDSSNHSTVSPQQSRRHRQRISDEEYVSSSSIGDRHRQERRRTDT